MNPTAGEPSLEPAAPERLSEDGEGSGADAARGIPEDFEQITDTSLSYLSLEDLLVELLDRVREIVGADTAAILLYDPERNLLMARAARGIEGQVRQGVQIPVGRGFAGRIAAERRPIIIEDVDHSYVLNPLLRQRGIQSLLGVPLLVEGRVVGVMHVGTLKTRLFTEDDVRLLQLAADRAALAIDNAQLSEQRAMTEVLQRVLLPEVLPQIPGLRLSGKYVPAASGLKVGGDWYDVFMLEDGRVAVITGDVVGRGIAAATVMAEVRTAVRAYSLENPDPLEVVAMLNRLLLNMGRKRSATMMYMALELETCNVVAVNAGHPPALMLDGEGNRSYVVEASGPPLGVWAGARYSAQELVLPLGSSLLLYTDGLIERRGEDIDAGLERLAASLSDASARRDRPLADYVFNRVARESSMEDDVALLAVEALPLGDEMSFTLEARPVVLSGLRRALGRWLAAHEVGDEDTFDIALAASEAAANAIEHAYGPAEATFEVACSWTPKEVTVEVRDSGTWRAMGKRERGRGLDIIGRLMDELTVERGESGTRVRLVKRLAS